MERLNESSPLKKLTEEQKKEIAEIENRHNAKLAEREIAMQSEIAQERMKGDYARAQELEQEWAIEKKNLVIRCDEKKDAIRNVQ